MSFIKISIYIGNLLFLTNAILYFRSLYKNIKAPKIFALYLFLCSINQIVSLVLLELTKNNIFLSHFYFIIQFILLSFFYRELFENRNLKRTIIIILITIITIILLQYYFDPYQFYKFNLFEILLTSLPLIMYSIIHFYNLLGKEKRFFYINSGILLYLSGSTLLFVAGNYVVSSNSILNKSIWIINSVLFVIYQVLILIEWRKSFYQKKAH